jgi:tRNA pseudouridine65 synthase
MGRRMTPELGTCPEDRPGALILDRGEDWVVVAKPPGVMVHRGRNFRDDRPMLQRVRDQLGQRVWPIHRLDRQASGCLLFGLRQESVTELSEALAEGQKTYVAFVRGYFHADGRVLVERPMKDSKGRFKDSRSTLWCIGRSHSPRCSALLVQPETGRYHQVRRHVRDLSHPILHDGDHGDSRVNRWWREHMGMNRLGLHAQSLSLPLSTGRIEVSCPLFEDHGRIFSAMPWWADALSSSPDLGLPFLPIEPPSAIDIASKQFDSDP